MSVAIETSSPCEVLHGRLREICAGESGLPEPKRIAYLKRWVGRGDLPPETFERLGLPDPKVKITADAKTRQKLSIDNCIHHGKVLRTEPCVCPAGNVNEVRVFACSLFNEVTHFRSSLDLPTCKGCEKREPKP